MMFTRMISMAVLLLGTGSGLFSQTVEEPDYPLGPDSKRQDGVPSGKVTQYRWENSRLFPGTVRDYWIYVPAQYNGSEPACVMVFQDGGGFVNEKGRWQAPVVMDNLIHRGEMPVTIGIFINPGVVPASHPGAQARYNRSFEYDGMGDRYARFLLEEILPEVEKSYRLRQDGNSRGIAGSSSGAVCAFTAAWERPDAFQRVYTGNGTFVNLREGHHYPWMIRKMETRPLRIFMQDGRNDLNIYPGNWWIANQDVHSALVYAGYQVEHVWGEGGHNNKHGSSILPDALRYLWKDYPQAIPKPHRTGSRALDVWIEGESWQEVAKGVDADAGLAVDAEGGLCFHEAGSEVLRRVHPSGRISTLALLEAVPAGMRYSPQGQLLLMAKGSGRLVAFTSQGAWSLVKEGIRGSQMAIGPAGSLYLIDDKGRGVKHVRADGAESFYDGVAEVGGIAVTPDQAFLLVSDRHGAFVHSVLLDQEGAFHHGQPYHMLHRAPNEVESRAAGMTVDIEGRVYVATPLGVQVCDQPGRVNGILSKPGPGELSHLVFGGKGHDVLYALCGDRLYSRRLNAKGHAEVMGAVQPPKPRL